MWGLGGNVHVAVCGADAELCSAKLLDEEL